MTTPEIIEIRKWCIETALDRCEDPMDAPGLAAALIPLLEGAGTVQGYPYGGTLDFSRMKVGEEDVQLSPIGRCMAREIADGRADPPPDWPLTEEPADDGVDDPVNRTDDTAGDVVEPPCDEGPLADLPPRSIPRMDAAPHPAPLAPDLGEREQAVLDAIHLLLPDGHWPTHSKIAEESEVPVGSLSAVLERLLEKGYLARPDGRWTVAKDITGAAA